MSGAVNNADDLAFRFVSGHRALDLLATLGNRHRSAVERLREPADLDRWLTAAELPTRAKADHEDLHDARQLRETVNRLVRATLGDQAPKANDLRELNRRARLPALTPQLDSKLRRRWTAAEHPVRAALALIAREAAELLTSPDRTLIRECAAAPNCSLLYLDRSRAGRRRWCEMNRCGSRAKMTTYRNRRNARTRTAPTPNPDLIEPPKGPDASPNFDLVRCKAPSSTRTQHTTNRQEFIVMTSHRLWNK